MSNDLNQCQFIGRLGQDPEIKSSAGGDVIASFSIACGSSWKDKQGVKQERTEWVNCSAFGKLAEIIAEYVKKGSQIYVSGKIKTDKYEKDGQTRHSTKIVVNDMQMLGGKPQGESKESKHEAKPNRDAFKEAAAGEFSNDYPFSSHGKCGAGVSWRCM